MKGVIICAEGDDARKRAHALKWIKWPFTSLIRKETAVTPTITPTTFPLDGIITCGRCGCAMALQHNPLPRYVCQSGCDTPALKAIELNHLAITTLFGAMVNEQTRDEFRAEIDDAFRKLKDEQPSAVPAEPPNDAQIRRLLADPEAILNHDLMRDARFALCEATNRIEVHGNTATIHYARPLPQGSEPVVA